MQLIFPGKISCLQLLLTAFINLNLVIEGEKSYEIDRHRFELFSSLKNYEQYALLCAASSSKFSRDMLKKEAQLFIDCISSIPESGYSRSTLLKLAFLLGVQNSDSQIGGGKSRFAKILEAANMEKNLVNSEQAGGIIDRMIDFAIEFGLLLKKGINEDGKEIYIPGPAVSAKSQNDFMDCPKVINIESTFTVTTMPGLSFNKLLPLCSFLSIKSQGIVSE